MAEWAHHVKSFPLYDAQAHAAYQPTTERLLRPSARRAGLARIRDEFSFLLAHSAGMLAAFRRQEDGSLRRLQHDPPTLRRALVWHVPPGRPQDRVSDRPG
jgi:hypothetical protein